MQWQLSIIEKNTLKPCVCACRRVFHWAESTSPVCWTWVSGKSSFERDRTTMMNYDNMRKHQKTFGKDPGFSCITTVHNTLDQPPRTLVWKRPTHTHTHLLPFLPLRYPSPPSMFVLIDFCGVRSLRTAADRPAIHLQFKECSGRSVPFLFVLYRMMTSSGTLPCQQRGWQRS